MLIASTLFASTAGPLFTRQINRKQWHCSVQAPRGLIVTLLKSSFSEICEEIVSGVRSAHTRHYLSIADGYQKIVIIAWLWSLKQKHTLPDHRPVLLKVKQNIRYFHSGHHREKSRLNLNAVHFNFIVCLFVFAHTYLRTRCLLRVRVKCLSPKQRGQSDIGLQKLPETMPLASGLRFEVFPNTQQLHVETPTCTDTHTLTDTQDVQLRWW